METFFRNCGFTFTSRVWDYFTVSADDEQKAKCNECGIQLSRKGRGTGCQRKHLVRKHPEIYKQFEAKEKEDVENKTKHFFLNTDNEIFGVEKPYEVNSLHAQTRTATKRKNVHSRRSSPSRQLAPSVEILKANPNFKEPKLKRANQFSAAMTPNYPKKL
uniref:BED-type domain-containing protein n=1 Tax=Romanomermis culicivorax TaxID=13658 RepID=A0A915IAH6_ROMCU